MLVPALKTIVSSDRSRMGGTRLPLGSVTSNTSHACPSGPPITTSDPELFLIVTVASTGSYVRYVDLFKVMFVWNCARNAGEHARIARNNTRLRGINRLAGEYI